MWTSTVHSKPVLWSFAVISPSSTDCAVTFKCHLKSHFFTHILATVVINFTLTKSSAHTSEKFWNKIPRGFCSTLSNSRQRWQNSDIDRQTVYSHSPNCLLRRLLTHSSLRNALTMSSQIAVVHQQQAHPRLTARCLTVIAIRQHHTIMIYSCEPSTIWTMHTQSMPYNILK